MSTTEVARRGFSEAEVRAILVDNPRRLLTLAPEARRPTGQPADP